MIERRRCVRIPESLSIVYEVVPGQTRKEYITKDISQGGMRFLINEFISKDSRLRIKISFHETLFSLEIWVKCAWIRKIPYSDRYEIGVEFVDMPSKAGDYLIGFIKDYLDTKAK
ncbi:MAG: PilZ domain-containing protein [Candidatus Omnitrophica bacterium]|nr:PilZ domain-containing protein [Candidatus Omnitrophota bacterium]